MLAVLISSFFIGAAGFAVVAIAVTERNHAGAWGRLAEERRALRARDLVMAAEARLPTTVTTRAPVTPAGGYRYERRFMPRAGSFPAPFPGGLPAAA